MRSSEEKLNERAIMSRHGLDPMGTFTDVDVFLCGWLKSGNTWCQRLLSGIYWGVDTEVLTDQLAQALVPDVHFKEFIERFGPTMLWKSHHLPAPTYRRVIHLVRDGRDATLSYWHMLRRAEPSLTLEDMFSSEESRWHASWEHHCSEWVRNPFGAEILRVRYEDLLSDPLRQLRSMADFLGRPRPDERLWEIYRGASIGNMRKIAESSGWANPDSRLTQNFLRRGEAESWRSEVPPPLIEQFNKRCGRVLLELGYTL